MKPQEILQEIRKNIARREKRSVIDVERIGVDASRMVEQPMVALHPETLFAKLGVKVMDKLTENLIYPLISSQTTAQLDETENPQEFIDQISFSSLLLTPKRFFSYVEYSKKILMSNNAELVSSLLKDMELAIIETVEGDVFNGIYDSESASSISDYADIVALELAASQKKISNPVYVVSPLAAQKLKSMLNSVFPVWLGDRLITGKMVVESPLLTDEKIILGDWSRLVVGIWDKQSDYTLDDFTGAKDGIAKIIINSYWNGGLVDPDAFVFATTEAEENNVDPEPEPDPNNGGE